MVLKLYYFPVAARGEATRLILTVGKVPFEDVHVNKDTWPEFKPKTPLGQLPVLELEDGRMIAQSGAIERYTAKLGGLYPQDAVAAAHADQAAFLVQDVAELLMPTLHMPDGEAKLKARQELVAGPLKEKLGLLARTVEKQPYLAGDSLTFADLTAFSVLGWLKSGTLDGIPATLLNDFPPLKVWYNKVASHEAIKARYANATGMRVTYQGA